MKYGPATRRFLDIARDWRVVANCERDPVEAEIASARCALAWSYVHRSIAGFVIALVVMFGGLTGCGVRDTAAQVVPELDQYEIYRCGEFTGYKALMSTKCENDDVMVGGNCEFHGGPPETEMSPDDQSLECATTWADSVKGGKICVHVICAPRAK
jgi:hypothetical protein